MLACLGVPSLRPRASLSALCLLAFSVRAALSWLSFGVACLLVCFAVCLFVCCVLCVSLLSPTVALLLSVALGRPTAASIYAVEVLLPLCAGRLAVLWGRRPVRKNVFVILPFACVLVLFVVGPIRCRIAPELDMSVPIVHASSIVQVRTRTKSFSNISAASEMFKKIRTFGQTSRKLGTNL